MNRLSPKKHGLVKMYIRPEIDRMPWVRRLNGTSTTKTMLERVRKHMAKRLKRPLKDLHYEPYAEGWIFLLDEYRIIYQYNGLGRNPGWAKGERWTIKHEHLHGDNPDDE